MTSIERDPTWVADPGIGWRILLVAQLADAPDDLPGRLATLFARQGWHSADDALTVRAGTAADLTAGLCGHSPAPLLVGHSIDHLEATPSHTLVLSAHHRDCDGLGLLTVLAALTGTPVSSAARGVGDRPHRGRLAGGVRRVVEAALAPPAPVVLGRPGTPGSGDAFASTDLGDTVGTADLVSAGAAAVAALATRPTRRVAVAVGVARRPTEADEPVADRSELLRLRGVDDATAVAELLRTAPLEPAVGRDGTPGGGGRIGQALTGAAMARLRSRLGSTLLVSHLGAVTAPGVRHLAFYPVTAGGSGISIGALTLGDRTTLTARGRAAEVDRSALDRLLAATTSRLSGS